MKKAAVGGASVAVLYAALKFTSAGSRPVYASITGNTANGGCTPGFWKTDTKSTLWPAAYDKSDLYDVIFEVPAAYAAALGGGKSLLTVFGQGGGCEMALGATRWLRS